MVYYLNERIKRIYISKVYNNDCNHCSNEIKEAFRKWLIIKDYDNQPSPVHITSAHDVKKSSGEERREALVLKYKEKGYTVMTVGFSYTQD